MAWNLVADTEKGTADGNAVTSDAIDTTGADLLVVGCEYYQTGGVDPTLSDSKSNTWTRLTESIYQANGASCVLFYCFNPTVGSGHTFTLSGTGTAPTIHVQAWSGADQTAPFDQEDGDKVAVSADPTCPAGTVTPTEDGELIVAAVSGYPNGTISVDEGMTLSGQIAYGTPMLGAMAYLVQGTAAAVSPVFTTTTGFTEGAAVVATFKAAAGGPLTGITAVRIVGHSSRLAGAGGLAG